MSMLSVMRPLASQTMAQSRPAISQARNPALKLSSPMAVLRKPCRLTATCSMKIF
jgi:hypothetical protein